MDLDGELIGKTPGQFSVVPDALKVLVPASPRRP
jgi:diacylglycerol kinase family enzyme